MFRAPKDDHALQKRGTGAASAYEQVQQSACNWGRRLVAQRKAILSGSDLEELHLAAHVVQSRDQQVHGSIHGMELRVLRLRQPDLREQLSNEAYIAPRVVSILYKPLR